MTKEALTKTLKSGRISMATRDELVTLIIAGPSAVDLTEHLLLLVFEEDKTDLWQCSWVFDNVMRKNLSLLLPILISFVKSWLL